MLEALLFVGREAERRGGQELCLYNVQPLEDCTRPLLLLFCGQHLLAGENEKAEAVHVPVFWCCSTYS